MADNKSGGNAGNTNKSGTVNAGAADAQNLNPSTGPATQERAAKEGDTGAATSATSSQDTAQPTSPANTAIPQPQVGPTAEQIAKGNTDTSHTAQDNSSIRPEDAQRQQQEAKQYLAGTELPGAAPAGPSMQERVTAASGNMQPRPITEADLAGNPILSSMGLKVGDVIPMPGTQVGGPDTNVNRIPHTAEAAPAFAPQRVASAELPAAPAGQLWAERNGTHTLFTAAAWELLGSDTAGWRRVNSSTPEAVAQYRKHG